MRKTLLFVRERAKDQFIKTANSDLKFANNLFKAAKKAGFDDLTAWKVAGIAYSKPGKEQIAASIKNLLLGKTETFEISGLKLSANKVAELMELPDLSGIYFLIEQPNELSNNLGQIPFDRIENGDRIEIDPGWLTEQLESFSIHTENEAHLKTFQVFTELVKNINKLAASNHQRNFFGFLEAEGLVKWENSYFVIETKRSSLERLFNLFEASKETINKRESTGLKFSGDL